ncbi:enoyl-CoA delta isomerase 1, mitochondrial-like [Planococcus citri]|uniref:enoyl-CoA delta isomerase 1, mitochondrial-like n=1 Tax=Planococcus citri TaxID=170843 RepID=UPI0031F8ED92
MFRLRNFLVLKNCKFYSTDKKLIDLKTDEKTRISTLSLQKSPVNSLSTPFLAELGNIFDELETSKSTKGLIVTSNIPNIYSAGLDLMEFYQTDEKRLEAFWTTLQNTWLKIYTTSFPTVAVINGHAVAGGCLLAMSCEYRVMAGPNYTIGLNEAKIGINAPFWFIDVMKTLIGDRKTESAVLSGEMFPAEKALSIGLVDKVVQNVPDALNEANTYLQNAISLIPDSRAIMKRDCRRDVVEKFLKGRKEELKFIVGNVLLPQNQERFKVYFESMKKKK